MIKIDRLEGVIGDCFFHYDFGSDVLYLRLEGHRDTPAIGDPSDDEVYRMRSVHGGEIVGLDIVDWWKRSGEGQLPDSMTELARRIEPWTWRVAA